MSKLAWIVLFWIVPDPDKLAGMVLGMVSEVYFCDCRPVGRSISGSESGGCR